MSNELMQQQAGVLSFAGKTFDEAIKVAELLASSDLVPKDYRNKPGNILVAAQMGADIGLGTMQAIQNIAVINGRPCMWGDALVSIVLKSKECESLITTFDEETMTATCTAKRKDYDEPHSYKFSKEQAVTAKLWNKPGPWSQYPQRMLEVRARAFLIRNLFSDVLAGLRVAEEERDTPAEKEVNTLNEVKNILEPKPVEKEVLIETPTMIDVEVTEELPMPNVVEDDTSIEESLMLKMEAAETTRELHAIVPLLADVPDDIKDKLRVAFKNNLARVKG